MASQLLTVESPESGTQLSLDQAASSSSSSVEFRRLRPSRFPPLRAGVPGAITVAVEEIAGRPAIVVRSRHTRLAGALSAEDGKTIAFAADLALSTRRPLVLVLASSGADVGEGLPALHGWGVAARAVSRCSGVVPLVTVLAGPAVAGPALLVGMADVVVACENCVAYLSGPNMVETLTGVRLSPAELGGAGVHFRASGVAALVAADVDEALDLVDEVLCHLPAHTDEDPPSWPTDDPIHRSVPVLRDLVPPCPTGSYDVRDAIHAIADEGELLEIRGGWAPNLITALARLGGHPIGVVANQPSALAGTLDIAASQKGAGFIDFCDSMNLPIVTLVDTSGFLPGKDLEWRGIIRHGAQLAFAYAQATVPRVCVILRKAYGGAYIVMDSKSMGNDLCLAWPTAEVAVMGAKGAVEILHRQATTDERATHQADYEARFLTPWVAAQRGYIDAVIDPADTREALGDALNVMASKREMLVSRKHGNSPL